MDELELVVRGIYVIVYIILAFYLLSSWTITVYSHLAIWSSYWPLVI